MTPKPNPRKPRKLSVCTRYAVKRRQKFLGHYAGTFGSFDNAFLLEARSEALAWCRRGDIVVPVRCREMSARTKVSKKRTR